MTDKKDFIVKVKDTEWYLCRNWDANDAELYYFLPNEENACTFYFKQKYAEAFFDKMKRKFPTLELILLEE